MVRAIRKITEFADPEPIPDHCWIQTASGQRVDLLDPRVEQIHLVDIAHHSGRIPRFFGGTIGPFAWSLAEHGVLVERLMPFDATPDERLAAILHDGHEVYGIGDVATPAQNALRYLIRKYLRMSDVRTLQPIECDPIGIIQRWLQKRIHQRFGLLPQLPSELNTKIRAADRTALLLERGKFVASSSEPWFEDDEKLMVDAATLHPDAVWPPLGPVGASQLFFERCQELLSERYGTAEALSNLSRA